VTIRLAPAPTIHSAHWIAHISLMAVVLARYVTNKNLGRRKAGPGA
jgi:hypothetical protein